jgi:hypothetical protein
MYGDLSQSGRYQVARRLSRAGETKRRESLEADVVLAEHEQRVAQITYAQALQHEDHLLGLANKAENIIIEHDTERQDKTRYLDDPAKLRTSVGIDKIENALHDGLGLSIRLYAVRVGLRS